MKFFGSLDCISMCDLIGLYNSPREYDQCLQGCPCHEKCPDGCPCDTFKCNNQPNIIFIIADDMGRVSITEFMPKYNNNLYLFSTPSLKELVMFHGITNI